MRGWRAVGSLEKGLSVAAAVRAHLVTVSEALRLRGQIYIELFPIVYKGHTLRGSTVICGHIYLWRKLACDGRSTATALYSIYQAGTGQYTSILHYEYRN